MSQTKLTQGDITRIMEDSEFLVHHEVFSKVTILSCKLPNGFVITVSSGAVDPQNYDPTIGEEVCMKRIEDKIWELEGYLLSERINISKKGEE